MMTDIQVRALRALQKILLGAAVQIDSIVGSESETDEPVIHPLGTAVEEAIERAAEKAVTKAFEKAASKFPGNVKDPMDSDPVVTPPPEIKKTRKKADLPSMAEIRVKAQAAGADISDLDPQGHRPSNQAKVDMLARIEQALADSSDLDGAEASEEPEASEDAA